MTAAELELALEKLIDTEGLAAVVKCLGDICHAKAEHLRSYWQDEADAKIWAGNGNALWKVSQHCADGLAK